MRQPVPASGFRLISGKRNPPDKGRGYWVQVRCGWVDMQAPWPAKGPRWKHTGDDWDAVAVKDA
jgi:hypothetical protein